MDEINTEIITFAAARLLGGAKQRLFGVIILLEMTSDEPAPIVKEPRSVGVFKMLFVARLTEPGYAHCVRLPTWNCPNP